MANDLFGKALLDYSMGKKYPIYFVSKDIRKERSVSRYFRKPEELSKIEKALIDLAFGSILDIGCATGYYIPALMEKGDVTGIDKSASCIKVANNSGLSNCFCKDIFEFTAEEQYDTITLLENNLGLGGSIEKTQILLTLLHKLISNKGQILMIQREIKNDFIVSELNIEYRKENEKFYWLHISSNHLKAMSDEVGFECQILQRDNDENLYLAKLTKKP